MRALTTSTTSQSMPTTATGHVTKSVAITVTDLNEFAPNITSGATGTIAENSSTSTLVYGAAATDQDGDTITYSLDAGGDNSPFNINSSNGQVMFKASPNYEAPGDAGGNNVYDIVVRPTTAMDMTSRRPWRSR